MSRKQFSEPYLSHYHWHKDGDATPWIDDTSTYDGKITAAAAAGDFDVDNRTDALVEALSSTKKVLIKPPNGIVSMELRFRGDGNAGDQHILPVFAAAGVDHYDLIDTLTIDQGTQIYTAGSIYFIDTVVSAGEKWDSVASELSSTTNNIGRYVLNTHGYDRFWIVASTLDANTTNLYIDWKQL